MRKHSIFSRGSGVMLALCMISGLLAGCGTSVEETQTPAETTVYEAELSEAREAMDKVMSADADEVMSFDFSYDPEAYIQVDDAYENMPLKNVELTVSIKDVDAETKVFCEQYAEETVITDRGAENGDTVVMDFEGTEDGNIICKETSFELELGTGDANEQFEAAILGAKTDDVVNVSIQYSQDNDDETLAGKTVDYNIRIREIKDVTIPKLTDDLVKEHTDYTTVTEYKEAVKKRMEREYVTDAIDEWLNENSKLLSVPSSLQEKYEDELLAYYSYVAEYYENTDEESVLKEAGYDSIDAMLEDNQDSIDDSAQNELIYAYIISEQGIVSTMGDYQDFLKEQSSENGCSEVGELLILYSEDDLRVQFMKSLADDWIYERCTINK